MAKQVVRTWPLAVIALVALGVWAVVPSEDAFAGKPPQVKCCNPDNEPGVGDNPICFEGHTCCSDGQWRCNNPDGSPSCDPGEVCEAGCGDKGDPCDVDEDCCSGDCKPNGTCK
jgi:hypothetical protein